MRIYDGYLTGNILKLFITGGTIMFKTIIISLSVIAFTLIPKTQIDSFSAPLPYSENVYLIKTADEITSEFKYLSDKTGKNYAGEFYLKNNTEKYLRVRWTLKGGVNTNAQSEAGTVDIQGFTKVCIATVFPQDAAKPWEPGILKFDWEQIK
jgi:hypothetical protein